MKLVSGTAIFVCLLICNCCHAEIAFDYREQLVIQACVPGWRFFNAQDKGQDIRIAQLHVRRKTHYNHGVLAEGITKVAVYECDSRGNKTFEGLVQTFDSTKYWSCKHFTYDLSNHLMTERDSSSVSYFYRFFYNSKGQRIKSTATIHNTVVITQLYFYDKEGRLIELRRTQGKDVTSYLFRYNAQGLLCALTHLDNKVQFEKMQFTYNTEMRIDTMKESRTRGVDSVTDYLVYQYDKSGNVTGSEWYERNGGWLSRNTFEFDNKNQLIFQQYASSFITSPRKFEYDSAGLETKEWNSDKPQLYDILVYNFTAPPETIVLQNVNFESGKSTLLSSSFSELNALSVYLQENPTKRIEISGHTDNVGNSEKNQQLSEARAKAVRDYLISQGIDSTRIEYRGYGSSKPVASNETEEGRAENRRVEFVMW